MSDEILTTEEAAAAMKVSAKTILRLIAAGDLPAVKVGKGYRVHRDDLPTARLGRKPAGRPRRQGEPGSARELLAQVRAS